MTEPLRRPSNARPSIGLPASWLATIPRWRFRRSSAPWSRKRWMTWPRFIWTTSARSRCSTRVRRSGTCSSGPGCVPGMATSWSALRRPWTATRNTAAITWAWVPRGGSIRRRRGPAGRGWRWPAGRTVQPGTESFTNYDVANSLRYTHTWGRSRSGNWRHCSSVRAAGPCG